MSEFFVYVDWTLESLSRPYYVGYGSAQRVKNTKRNVHHTNVKQKYGLRREVVLITSLEDVAKREEIRLIAEHHTFVYGEGYVFGSNYTVGGDGARGHRQPPASDVQREASRRANSHPKSDETKLKMKVAAQQRAADPLWIAKMQRVALERWQDPAYIAKRVGMKYNKGASK